MCGRLPLTLKRKGGGDDVKGRQTHTRKQTHAHTNTTQQQKTYTHTHVTSPYQHTTLNRNFSQLQTSELSSPTQSPPII